MTAPTVVSRRDILSSSKNNKFNKKETGIEITNLHTSDFINASFFVMIKYKKAVYSQSRYAILSLISLQVNRPY